MARKELRTRPEMIAMSGRWGKGRRRLGGGPLTGFEATFSLPNLAARPEFRVRAAPAIGERGRHITKPESCHP